MADNLMRILMDGPDVSLRGSQTVSPTTAALWASDPFMNMYCPQASSSPSLCLEMCLLTSMYFLVLSQAPPVLENEKAIWTPDTMIPARRPLIAWIPNKKPMMRGDQITKRPGANIFLREAFVEMAMH